METKNYHNVNTRGGVAIFLFTLCSPVFQFLFCSCVHKCSTNVPQLFQQWNKTWTNVGQAHLVEQKWNKSVAKMRDNYATQLSKWLKYNSVANVGQCCENITVWESVHNEWSICCNA